MKLKTANRKLKIHNNEKQGIYNKLTNRILIYHPVIKNIINLIRIQNYKI
jgi:hypothetical protein